MGNKGIVEVGIVLLVLSFSVITYLYLANRNEDCVAYKNGAVVCKDE